MTKTITNLSLFSILLLIWISAVVFNAFYVKHWILHRNKLNILISKAPPQKFEFNIILCCVLFSLNPNLKKWWFFCLKFNTHRLSKFFFIYYQTQISIIKMMFYKLWFELLNNDNCIYINQIMIHFINTFTNWFNDEG